MRKRGNGTPKNGIQKGFNAFYKDFVYDGELKDELYFDTKINKNQWDIYIAYPYILNSKKVRYLNKLLFRHIKNNH